jgi:hypothetical protein
MHDSPQAPHEVPRTLLAAVSTLLDAAARSPESTIVADTAEPRA